MTLVQSFRKEGSLPVAKFLFIVLVVLWVQETVLVTSFPQYQPQQQQPSWGRQNSGNGAGSGAPPASGNPNAFPKPVGNPPVDWNAVAGNIEQKINLLTNFLQSFRALVGW